MQDEQEVQDGMEDEQGPVPADETTGAAPLGATSGDDLLEPDEDEDDAEEEEAV